MANSRLAIDDSRLKFKRKWTGSRPKILYKGSPMWFSAQNSVGNSLSYHGIRVNCGLMA